MKLPLRFAWAISPREDDDMTLAKPREHKLAKSLRRLADVMDAPGPDHNSVDAHNFRSTAATLDQTIASLGIWKDPARIEHTNAYRQAKVLHDRYLASHPGRA